MTGRNLMALQALVAPAHGTLPDAGFDRSILVWLANAI